MVIGTVGVVGETVSRRGRRRAGDGSAREGGPGNLLPADAHQELGPREVGEDVVVEGVPRLRRPGLPARPPGLHAA